MKEVLGGGGGVREKEGGRRERRYDRRKGKDESIQVKYVARMLGGSCWRIEPQFIFQFDRAFLLISLIFFPPPSLTGWLA